jgi:hypothetical protein
MLNYNYKLFIKGFFMSKTNYTKAEEALSETLQKMTMNKFQKSVDKRGTENATAANTGEDKNPIPAQKHLLISLYQDLKLLSKHNQEIYEKLSMKKKDLKKFLDHPEAISLEEWEKIKQLRVEVDNLKKDLPQPSDEDIIKQQKRKHITKRFNINEKWMPLK